MADIYVPIDGNNFFKHFEVVDNTNYQLYFAIQSAFNFLVTGGGAVTDPEYPAILSSLDTAMKTETNLMNSTQVSQAIIWLAQLRDVSGVDDKYTHLYYLFNSLSNLGMLSTSAKRILTLSSTKSIIEYDMYSVENKARTHTFYDGDRSIYFTINQLELLNLQAEERYVPAELVPTYIDGLDVNVPIEKVLTYNLFNFQTFSNSELYSYTLLPSYSTSEAQSFKFLELVYAAEYFYKEHTEYITFDNYVNFDNLLKYVTEAIKGFKYLLDYIDNLTISDSKDVLSYYPSGKTELYAEMESLRQTILNLGMAYDIAYLFKRQKDLLGNLNTIYNCLSNLETKLFTEERLVDRLMAEYSLTEQEAKDVLYNGGTSSQVSFVNGLIQESIIAYSNCSNNLSNAQGLAKEAQQMSSSYTTVSQYYNETQFDWTNINSSLNGNMSSINTVSSNSSTKLNGISNSLLNSYNLTRKLNSLFDLSLLLTLASFILKFNLLSRLASCALMAISCAANFIASILSEIANLGGVSNIDFSSFSLSNLINSASSALSELSISDMMSKTSAIMDELSSHFTAKELEKIASSLISAISGINTSCFTGGMNDMYNEVFNWVKASLAQGQVCKFKPPNLNKFKLNLNRNGIKLPKIDLRFKLRTCTGA